MRRPLAALFMLALAVTLTGCFDMPQPPTPSPSVPSPSAPAPSQPQPAPSVSSPSAPTPSVSVSTAPSDSLAPDLSEPTPPAGPYEEATEEHPARNVPIPTLDDAASKNDDAGVLATVKFYIQAQDFVKQTGNAKPLSQIVDRECQACMQYATSVNFLTYSKGSWYVGEGVSVDEVQVGTSQSDPKITIVAYEFLEPEIILVEDGAAQVVENEHSYNGKLALRFDEVLGHWMVVDVAAELIK